ncbi:hypothetical protein Ahy_B03g066453 [Arachis hypogaea]|uniref:Aminotransferase-like plant mobile domain-containing protein n=1 Tax=Arachis hypogaea TaxID=3818 RepID=A0A445A407_ARAHY|nr:hypothetical protein Ahy_B03g066453 [Arachis hypogaea]
MGPRLGSWWSGYSVPSLLQSSGRVHIGSSLSPSSWHGFGSDSDRYLIQMIQPLSDSTRGYLMIDRSNNQVHLRWLPLLDDFQRCRSLFWGSAVLVWAYHFLCSAAHCSIIDIARCTPLLVYMYSMATSGPETWWVLNMCTLLQPYAPP